MTKNKSDQFNWNQEMETIDTTIGELVEAITQIALESGKTEEEGYELAAVAIESILRRNLKYSDTEEIVN